MTSLYMTTSTRRVSKSTPSNDVDVDDKNEAPVSSTLTNTTSNNNNNNNMSPTITSIGSTILRKFERITSLIDESLDSDTLLPSLCHKQGSNIDNNCLNKLNDTSYTSTDDTALNTTGESSQDNSFVLSPTSLANECNLHFATWLQSQEFDASGIVSHGDNSRPEEQSIQFSRDEFLEASREGDDDVDEYVSIKNADKRRGDRNHNPWPPKLPLAVTDVWDSIVSSNWKCWQQHDKGKESPMTDNPYKMSMTLPSAQSLANPPQSNNRNKDSSYTVDALEGEIPMKLLSSNEEVLKTATDPVVMESISATKSSHDEQSSKDGIKVQKTSKFNVVSQQDTQQTQTSSPMQGAEEITPSLAKGTIGDFVWQENSQLLMMSTTPSPSLAGSSLVGEDIPMTSNHSCTYSESPDRSSVRSRKSTSAEALPDSTTAPPAEEGSPQTSLPEASKLIVTETATAAIDEFDDSFPSVVQLPPEDDEVHEENNCCHTPLMDTSILNSSDDPDDDRVGGDPINKSTKDRTLALKMKWNKAKSRNRWTK